MRVPWSGDESLRTKLTDNPRARFRAWRKPRPVFGGFFLIIGGLLIGYVPLQFASELMLIGGAFTVVGLLFAALVSFCGVGVLAKPRYSTIFGVFGVAFSTLSLFGALGGLFIGMLVGTLGGVLSYAWEPPEGYEYKEPHLRFRRTEFIWQEASEFIWHAGPDVESTDSDTDASAADADATTDEDVTDETPPVDGDDDDGPPLDRPLDVTAEGSPESADESASPAGGDSMDEAQPEGVESSDGERGESVDDTEADDDEEEFEWGETDADVVDDRFEL
jgi:hypothetical protein